jgi:predicted Zn-dependent peptidase
MTDILDRKQLSDGIFFSRITDGRFKTNRISITFYNEFSEGRRSDFAILPYILTDSCRNYPNLTRLTERYSDLYGASVSDNLGCSWDRRSMTFTISSIDDRYTLDGEKLEEQCCNLLLDCLLDPVTDNGAFPVDSVEIMKQELIDAIESVKGDPRSYAAQQGAIAAFEGEPCGLPVNGTAEQARAITPQSAYSAYRDMLEHSRIEIFCSGCSDFSVSERIFAQRLGTVQRSGICELSPTPSPLKEVICRKSEKFGTQQAILRMYFKAPQLTDRYAGAILSMILGGMTTSRFFTNIREKQSLCYYCSCFSNRFKKTVTVYSGVDPANVAKTEHAVMSEFMNVCMRGITEEELEHAKLELAESARAVYDSPSALSSWYSSQVTDPEILTPEQFAEGARKVTARQVMEAARIYALDTVFTLSPEEVE